MVSDGGLGDNIVGDKLVINNQTLLVTKLLGEGGFSYVYLVKEQQETASLSHHGSYHTDKAKQQAAGAAPDPNNGGAVRRSSGSGAPGETPLLPPLLVLKVTSIHSRAQRDIAEKEAKLLSRLSHPSIIKMYDQCYRSMAHTGVTKGRKTDPAAAAKDRPQHIILMEYCEGGHALDVCTRLASAGQRFDLSTLIIAFGQICNAVSYLHAQRPPIVHRDLKPVNFLVKNGAYKLCDFGSAVFGHVDLRTPKARIEAEEVIQKTTTQMFRSPEMVDLYMAKKLTQATDVWALGCCLYSLAYLQNCFEEGSNLAILSRKYTIPEENPYGEGLVELLDRMLTVDSKARADMTEVILCLSAVYSGRPLPPRKKSSKVKKEGKDDAKEGEEPGKDGDKNEERVGTFRTDGQGIQEVVYDPTKATEGKKLASNSVAARRKRAAAATTKPPTAPTSAPPTAAPPAATATTSTDPLEFGSFHSRFSEKSGEAAEGDAPFSAAFGDIKGFDTPAEGGTNAFFGSFDGPTDVPKDGDATDAFAAAFDTAAAWGGSDTGASDVPSAFLATAEAHEKSPEESGPGVASAYDGTDDGGDDRKKDSPDSQRKERSRRRRPPGTSSRSSRGGPPDQEPGVSAGGGAVVDVAEGPSSSGEGGDSKDKKDKERKSRRSAKEDEEHRRSGSRSRRKGRGPREGGRAEGGRVDVATDESRKGPKRSGSFRNNRSSERGDTQPPSD